MPKLNLILSILFFATIAALSGLAQTKIDSYGRLPTDDESAHLDRFRIELARRPEMRGYVVGYNNDSTVPRGAFLRRLYGDRAYLNRGLEPDRLSVIDGGYRDNLTIELWIVPADAKPPVPEPALSPVHDRTTKFLFDEECLECSPAVFLDLSALESSLGFYAAELGREGRGEMIVWPSRTYSSAQALADARRARRKLAREFGIAQNRIDIKLAKRNKEDVATVEFWVIPRTK